VSGLAQAAPLFAGRSFRRYLRTPETMVSTIAFPLILLLTLLAVFGTSVEAFDDGRYAQRLVPALIVSSIMFGSIGTAVGYFTDLRQGYMDRVRTMPVAPTAPLVGSVIAEVPRAFSAVVVLVAVGSVVGFRFDNGVLATIGFVALVALAAVTFVWIGLALASRASSSESLAPPLSALYLLLLFFSRGLVPLDAYPGWAQPIVRVNPATSFVTALDHLARGGNLTGPLLGCAAWSVVIVGVCAASLRHP
jgi:ABC transporter DrrB family efflux protein